jgi:TPR repeat protein
MYREVLGVPQDKKEALQWYIDAARKEHVMAQFRLGSVHHNGQGVPRDDVKAYAWYGIAAAGGFKPAQRLRDEIQWQLSQEELQQARKLAKELWEKYGNKKQDIERSP